MEADVIVGGGGLAGLVACNELVHAGRRVALVEQENAGNLGGQAFWSFGGLFLGDSPMQRRRADVEFAASDKRPWPNEQGVTFTPLVGWAERGSSAVASSRAARVGRSLVRAL